MGGDSTGISQDFCELNQATNSWSQKMNFAGGTRESPIGFVIGNNAYVGSGIPLYNDLWEYTPALNSWTQKANLPDTLRCKAAAFSIGTKGYIGTGETLSSNSSSNSFYEWNQSTNTWTRKANYPIIVKDIDQATFTIGCHGYFAGGCCFVPPPPAISHFIQDFWEYTPDDPPPINASISNSTTICVGGSAILTASGGISYSWSTGGSSNSITVSPTSTTAYTVSVSNDCVSKTLTTTVAIINSSIASFNFEYNPCKNKCMDFIDQSANALTWNWDFGDGTIGASNNPCHFYNDSSTYNVSLIINKSTACADTFNMDVPYVTHDTTAFVYVPNAFSPNNDGDNDVLGFFRQDTFCLKNFEIAIYSRWGEKVFETTDINSTWDGTFNGEKLHSNVFSYYCKTVTTTGKQIIRKGNISLLQ